MQQNSIVIRCAGWWGVLTAGGAEGLGGQVYCKRERSEG